MARFQDTETRRNDQKTADHAVHQDFMDHLNGPLNAVVMDLPADGRAPKARKPYTISKQREKWTEDEHKLFLEALQQHGRAWRRIQEHIGSKTAVQIRSHAQKFFSKVIRESSGDGNSFAAAPQIQIPPPRPKRKPTHPYPRKIGNSPGKDAPALKQLEKPQLQIQQEDCSPKSVLTTGSQTLASDSCGSPASSVVIERCPTPSIEDVEFPAQVPPSKDDDVNTTSKGVACGIPEGSVLMLFGNRVVVNDLHQQSNSNSGSLQHATDMELDTSAETPSGTGKFSSHGAAEANGWNPWLTGTQQFIYYLPQGEVISARYACQVLSFENGRISCSVLNPHTVASSKQPHQPFQAADYKSTRAQGSWTESTTTSSSVPETNTQNSDSVESTQLNKKGDETIPVLGSGIYARTGPVGQRGFMPYKKCAAETKVPQSQWQVPSEEADGEMTRLCL